MNPFRVYAARLVAQSVVTVDQDEPAPSAHTVVVTGVPKRTVEAALAAYIGAILYEAAS